MFNYPNRRHPPDVLARETSLVCPSFIQFLKTMQDLENQRRLR